MKKIWMFFMVCGTVFAVTGAEIQGVPRDSNFNITGGYDSTRVQAQLVLCVKDETQAVHFIRDNNDPRVITKTYLLKNVDPYEFRQYLREMVQAKRVGNTTMMQQYPGNTATPPLTATASSIQLNTVNAQMGYTPPAQLGSNTAVECLKYVDGTGLLIVSAEEYRFKDSENGIGIDTLVATLDNPEIGAISTGSQMFIYMPKFVPAYNLVPLIENVGMNVSDVTELWQGQDIVTTDSDLNWLIFDVSNYSCDNIAKLLKEYDVPIPQVRLTVKVYELYDEDDDRIGIDFQSWKNNEGADFFSVGGRYRNNWAAIYNGIDGMGKGFGSERTGFFVFNPKWNTRYLDFLTSQGKASVLHSGELCIRNNTGGNFSRTTQIFYVDTSAPAGKAVTTPDKGVGAYELLSSLVGEVIAAAQDVPVGKGNKQQTLKSSGYGFNMQVGNASVNLKECRFTVTLSNSSLIGFTSNGSPRISQGNVVKQDVSLPLGAGEFVIGSLNRKSVVKSRSGIPFLMDIPYLGLLFSSESVSVKNSQLVVAASCEWSSPPESPILNRTKRQPRIVK
ncbi:MAG: hypothetical protein IKC89_07020 [Lentisphaeria bacterium]|nr:hypothetical protein [Lentisphaeria bacterium]